MTIQQPQRARMQRPLRDAALLLLAVSASLLAAAFLPAIDLSGAWGVALYYLAASGSLWSAGVIALLTACVVLRPGLPPRRRPLEALCIAPILCAAVGGVFLVNEYGLKVLVEVPRPNIQSLAEQGALGKSAAEFYALPDKLHRRDYLATVLTDHRAREMGLHPLVREHWLWETGYSFPSSHSQASFAIAAFFLATGLALGGSWRWPALLLVVPWAICVACSRVLLQVHTPLDVCVGALEGTAAGLAAFAFLRWQIAYPWQPDQA